MRKIKFRAKSVEDLDYPKVKSGEWVYGHSLSQYECGNIELNCVYCNPDTLCEYTGMSDKNGRSIYEGDIVTGADEYETQNILLEVKCGVIERTFHGNPNTFRISCFYFERVDTKEKLFKVMDNETHNLEIVGNVFDNSELLKTDK